MQQNYNTKLQIIELLLSVFIHAVNVPWLYWSSLGILTRAQLQQCGLSQVLCHAQTYKAGSVSITGQGSVQL